MKKVVHGLYQSEKLPQRPMLTTEEVNSLTWEKVTTIGYWQRSDALQTAKFPVPKVPNGCLPTTEHAQFMKEECVVHRVNQMLEAQISEHIAFAAYVRDVCIGGTTHVSLTHDVYFVNDVPSSPKKTIVTPAIQNLRKIQKNQHAVGDSPVQSRKTMAIVFNMFGPNTTVGDILTLMEPVTFKGVRRHMWHTANS